MSSENNEIVINNKNEILINSPKKKKKGKIIIFSCLGVIILALALFLSSNYFYEVFPDALAPRAYTKTLSVINNETKSVQKSFKEHSTKAKLSDINSYTFNFGSVVTNYTSYDDVSKLNLDFGGALLIDCFINDENFAFKINESEYYALDLNKASEQINGTSSTPNTTTSSYTPDVKMASFNINGNSKKLDSISSFITKDASVTLGNTQNLILMEYTTADFVVLVSTLLEVTPNDNNVELSEFFLNSFVLGSEKVFIELTVDSSGKFKNCIRQINVYTDAKSQKFIKIQSIGADNLLDSLTVSYKIFFKERNVDITTNFSTFDQDLNISINDLDFVFNISNDENTVSIEQDGKSFLVLANDNSEVQMPANINKMSETNIFKFYFDIMNIDLSPFTNFMNSFEDLLS